MATRKFTFEVFEVGDDNTFKYSTPRDSTRGLRSTNNPPPPTWNYESGDNILITTTSFPFTVTFKHVDAKGIALPDLSPLVDKGQTLTSKPSIDGEHHVASGTIKAKDSDPVGKFAMAPFRKRVAKYIYEFKEATSTSPRADSSLGGDWIC